MSTRDTEDTDAELLRVQQQAIDNAIEEMDAAAGLTLEDKQSRGDRGWLTGMAAKSLGVAVRIEQFLAARRDGKVPGDDEEEEHNAKRKLISKARGEVAQILERVGVGNQPRRR